MVPRVWLVVFAVWAALAVVFAVNVYHYAHAAFAGVP